MATTQRRGSVVSARELLEAGVHFGHQTRRWNPKMKPYIFTARNGIHIIDIKETIKGLLLAKKYVSKIVSEGKDVCFVGTKRQAKNVLQTRVPDVKMHYVTERWLGGTLTNFATVRERLARLLELEQLETTGGIEKYKKKDQSTMRREMKRIRRNLEGVRDLHGLPGALIVVDPRRTRLAKEADLWLQLRPGTDDALALAMLNVIIGEELHDAPFVARWTHGFDQLRDHVRPFTPEWAEHEPVHHHRHRRRPRCHGPPGHRCTGHARSLHGQCDHSRVVHAGRRCR